MKKFFKIFFILIAIILVLLLIHTMRNFIIITNLEENVESYADSTNYHLKATYRESTNKITTTYYYEKDGKQVVISEKNIDEIISKTSIYNNGERIVSYYDTPEGKTAQFDMPSKILIDITSYFEGYSDNALGRFIMSARLKIQKTEYNGKTCYAVSSIFEDPNGTEYIEKDTGLCRKIVTDEQIIEQEYEFNNVNDEVFIEPDISEYTIQEDN